METSLDIGSARQGDSSPREKASRRALAWDQGVHQSKSGTRYHLEWHGGLRMWVAMKGRGLPPPQSGMGKEGLG